MGSADRTVNSHCSPGCPPNCGHGPARVSPMGILVSSASDVCHLELGPLRLLCCFVLAGAEDSLILAVPPLGCGLTHPPANPSVGHHAPTATIPVSGPPAFYSMVSVTPSGYAGSTSCSSSQHTEIKNELLGGSVG